MCRSYYRNILLTLTVIKHPRVQALINRSDEHLPRTMLSYLRDASVLALKGLLQLFSPLAFQRPHKESEGGTFLLFLLKKMLSYR